MSGRKMYSFETNTAVEEMIQKSVDEKRLSDALQFIHDECSRMEISITDYRWQSLVNHVSAMLSRSKSGERLDAMDASIFAEIGEDSLRLAREVVLLIGNIQEDEKYLLSVHFEAAKTA